MSNKSNQRIIGRIARTELAALFGSPIAWFVLVIFCVLTMMRFCTLIENYLSTAEQYSLNFSQTNALLLTFQGFISYVSGQLYLYIPLLTMGLVSRELSSGSIKLVYSSPVSSLQFVLGKFLAAAVMGLCIMAIPVAASAGCWVAVNNFDVLPVLVALLGLYLQICVYAAIGLFMSCITSYQVVAAVATLGVLALLENLTKIGSDSEFLKQICYWLSIGGRSSSFFNGVFRTDDFLYFICMTALFIGLSTLRIDFPRRNHSLAARTGIVGLLLGSVFAAAFISSRPGIIGIYDATRQKINSISEGSRELVRAMDGKIIVNSYYNIADKHSQVYFRSLIKPRSIFEQYTLTKPDIEEHDFYYYADCPSSIRHTPARAGMSMDEERDMLTMLYHLNPRTIRSAEEMADVPVVWQENGQFVRELIAENGRRTLLRDFDDMEIKPSEAEITAALQKLFTEPPIVGFETSNAQRSLDGTSLSDYSDFAVTRGSRYALVNQGFDVVTTDLAAGADPELGMLVIADPRTEPSQEWMKGFREYIGKGGNLILCTDYAGSADAVLSELGLRASKLQIAAKEGDFPASLVLSRIDTLAFQEPAAFPSFGNASSRITMPGCVALDTVGVSDFRRTPLLRTIGAAWLESDYSLFRDDITEFDPQTEVSGSFVTAYVLTREVEGRTQRILVCADADCFSNAEMTLRREGLQAVNFQLVTSAFRWISGGRFPIKVEHPAAIDNTYRLTTASVPAIKAIFEYAFPALLALVALLVLARRRKG